MTNENSSGSDEFALLAAENAVHISSTIYSPENYSRYSSLYEVVASDLSGFPGIFKEIAKVGLAMVKHEQKIENPWDTFNWIDTCHAIGEWILDFCPEHGHWPRPSQIEDKLMELMPIP